MHPHPSTPSSPSTSTALDNHEESVRIAVRALGDMRNSTPSSFQPSSLPSPSTSDDINSPDLAYRVSHLPLVNTALRAYSQGKASSRVVKYGAEMMESSVRAVSRRLEANSPSLLPPPPPPLPPSSPPPPQPDSRSPTPHPDGRDPDYADQQVAQRSRWQAVLLEAGGFSAALSEENMRRLKYCLQWLQYATAHIDAQILILRDFTATLQPLSTNIPPPPPNPNSNSNSHAPTDPISPAHMRTLTDVRHNIVNTVRQVVDVVSKYAGGALPEPARARVRGFILKLPQNWASAAGVEVVGKTPGAVNTGATAGGSGGAVRGGRSHRRERSAGLEVSPASVSPPRIPRSPLAASPHHAAPPTAGAAVQAAQRVLVLATESLDMMRGVTGVMKDSLDRADAWVGRLRVVGLAQPGEQQGVEGNSETHPEGDDLSRSGGHGDGEDEYGSRSYYSASSTFSSVPSTPGPPSPGVGAVMGLGGLNLDKRGGGGMDDIKGDYEDEEVVAMDVDP